MSRTIKFRAWDMEEEMFFDPYNHNYLTFSNMLERDDRYVMQQFTDLLDKNGKEIYEGDIVRYTLAAEEEIDDVTYTEEVKFIDGSFDVDNAPLNAFNEECEIIGNIYSDPNLIK